MPCQGDGKPLLGEAPDPELVKEIEDMASSFDGSLRHSRPGSYIIMGREKFLHPYI